MFNVGDLVIYSAHGICRIDDICEKTYSGVTKTYYVMHPIEDNQLIINYPTDNNQVVMKEMMDKNEAEEILETFKSPGIGWIERTQDRTKMYSSIIKTGNRKDIAGIVNTLLRKKSIADSNGKKFGDADRRLLLSIQNILFKELAFSLNTTYEAIDRKVIRSLKQSS
jgi:CarD family transcriptional regulator